MLCSLEHRKPHARGFRTLRWRIGPSASYLPVVIVFTSEYSPLAIKPTAIPPRMIVGQPFTQLDYARAMAFVAIEEATGCILGGGKARPSAIAMLTGSAL